MSFRHIVLISLSLLVIGAVDLDGLYAQSTAQDKGIYLIVRGDDIGSSHAADVACIRSYKEGIMTTVELMVPCSWFPEAVKLLNENPGLDVGIHLVLTSEWENYKWRPLTWVPSLTDADGYFYPTIWQRKNMPPGMALRDANWKIEEIEKEMRAQIELAKRKVPHVSHLTCHMGCSNWDPKVKKVYTQLAKEYNLDIAPSEYGVQRTAGFGDAKTTKERTKRFIEMLEGLKPGTHLFIDHPALDTAEMRAIGHSGYYDVAEDRDAVTKVFISEEVKRAIKKLGIQLISYADLKKARTGKEIRFRFGSSEDKADTASRSRSQPKMEDNLFTSPKQEVTCTIWHLLRYYFESNIVADMQGVASGGFQLRYCAGELAVAAFDGLSPKIPAAPGPVQANLILTFRQSGYRKWFVGNTNTRIDHPAENQLVALHCPGITVGRSDIGRLKIQICKIYIRGES